MKAVVALGGNALTGKDRKVNFEKQIEATRNTARCIAKMIKNGWEIAITHGNGPQVGELLLQQKIAKKSMPLHACVALTQGQIGYLIQQSLLNEFKINKIGREVVTLITQVIVSENDSEFLNPTKPIGPVYSDDEIEEIKKIYRVGKYGSGWRILVPSPKPISIVEAGAIKKLIEGNTVVIAAGGGGIPVVEKNGVLYGVDAVVDKDLASQKLANEIEAETLLILTDVEHVFINYKNKNQKRIEEINADEIEEYYNEGHFPPGSMGPKIEAGINFVRNGGKEAIITSIEKAWDALNGRTGTHIKP
ncbi:MAG: carbamate kinase [Thermoplasmatales archaeon]|nr:carbamate kinase [Thermoplasmatales archaeon]